MSLKVFENICTLRVSLSKNNGRKWVVVLKLGQDAKATWTLQLLLYVSIHGRIAFLFQSFFPPLGNLRDFTLSQ